MTRKKNELLVYRLSEILKKLNYGETLYPQQLAAEFNTCLRTVQRDLNDRLNFMPLEAVGAEDSSQEKGYRLAQHALGKLSFKDIRNFSSIAGIQGLFPSLSEDFLHSMFDARMNNALLIRGPKYEDIKHRQMDFDALNKAINEHRLVSFEYQKQDKLNSYTQIEPYKLLNHNGIWYLIAHDGVEIKTFSFGKLGKSCLLDSQFQPNPVVEKRLLEDDGIWFGSELKEVVMTISSEVAYYFKRRNLFTNQTIVKELEDGGLIVSTRISHEKQILPIVRYWMPSIKIISPTSLQEVLEKELRDYLKLSNTNAQQI